MTPFLRGSRHVRVLDRTEGIKKVNGTSQSKGGSLRPSKPYIWSERYSTLKKIFLTNNIVVGALGAPSSTPIIG